MVNQELLEYVNKKISEGATKESLTSELTSGGWTEADINEALGEKSKAKGTNIVSIITSSFILFMFMAVSLMYLGMILIDEYLPENSSPEYTYTVSTLSVILIFFVIIPIVLFFNIRLRLKKRQPIITVQAKPSPITTKIYKPVSFLSKLARSILVFIGLWILWLFWQMAYFYHPSTGPTTIGESNLISLMLIPVFIIPIILLFIKK